MPHLSRCREIVRLAACAAFTGCIPYTVGHTARPAGKTEVNVTTSLFGVTQDEAYTLGRVPPYTDDQPFWNYVGIDAEVRKGVSDRADVGLRVTSLSGAVLTYMLKLNGRTDKPGPSISAMIGGGLVGEISYGMFEASVLASGDERGRFTPYGGIRYVAVKPISTGESDRPTFGGVFGLRIGRPEFGISPEIGAFYDEALDHINRRHLLVVPSVSIHGNPLLWLQRKLARR